MTTEKDPRIEAVAKLLFTGPLFQYNAEQWETGAVYDFHYVKSHCLMAAEDVLRGIDEAAGKGNEEASMRRVIATNALNGARTHLASVRDGKEWIADRDGLIGALAVSLHAMLKAEEES